jgi:voltage-gated potassium channel
VNQPIDPWRHMFNRLVPAAVVLAAVVGIGTVGYHWLGEGRWTWDECLYTTIITLSTVGSSELPGVREVSGGRAWTVGLIVFGSGSLVYFVSMLTAVVLEGDLTDALRRNRMEKAIGALVDHTIVCGVGSTGRHVIEELVATKRPFVAVDNDERRIESVQAEIGAQFRYVIGDATEDHILEKAGIKRAAGLVASLHDDRDNLFVTLSARSANDRLRIVAKCEDRENEEKLRRAGASAVVATTFIGGMRIASELMRPSVVQFLDAMVRDRSQGYRIEEVLVPKGSPIAGKTLEESGIRRFADVLVLSIREPGGRYVHNPMPSATIADNSHLVVLGKVDDVQRLHQAVGSTLRASG